MRRGAIVRDPKGNMTRISPGVYRNAKGNLVRQTTPRAAERKLGENLSRLLDKGVPSAPPANFAGPSQQAALDAVNQATSQYMQPETDMRKQLESGLARFNARPIDRSQEQAVPQPSMPGMQPYPINTPNGMGGNISDQLRGVAYGASQMPMDPRQMMRQGAINQMQQGPWNSQLGNPMQIQPGQFQQGPPLQIQNMPQFRQYSQDMLNRLK